MQQSRSGKTAYLPRGSSAWDGKRAFSTLPKAYDADGNELRRNLSCHVCTQGLASWKGNFSEPLACITCPRTYCSRCLTHIKNKQDVGAAEAFIKEQQGAWSCFHCTETCACQNRAYSRVGRPAIEAHKAAGWAGVSGGGVAVARPPLRRVMKSKAAPAPSPAPTPMPEGPSDARTPAPPAPPPQPPSPPSPPVESAPAEALPPFSAPAEAPPLSSAPAEASGPDLVGRACEAFWTAEQAWYRGTIAVWDARRKRHRIAYEDGDVEWVQLPDESVRLV